MPSESLESTNIRKIVSDRLNTFDWLNKQENCFSWRNEDIVTTLRFIPVEAEDTTNGVDSIAVIDSEFSLDEMSSLALGILNRRSVFGHFCNENGRLHVKTALSIYRDEPAYQWISGLLLSVFGEQASNGWAIHHSDISAKHLAAQRAHLDLPRKWASQHDPEWFIQSATFFRNAGFVATSHPHGLTLEVQLGPGGKSRLIDRNAETALLRVDTAIPHPTVGCGYFCSIALPYDPPCGTIADTCAQLNKEELLLADSPPRIGAWGLRGADNELVYTFFVPSSEPHAQIAGTLMNWNVRRTLWIKRNYWNTKKGINLGGQFA